MKKSLQNAVTRHQVYLERLKSSYANDFAGIIPKLERLITKTVSELRKEVGELSKKELEQLIGTLREQQLLLLAKNNEKFTDKLSALSSYEVSFEASLLKNTLAGAIRRLSLAIPKAEAAFRAAINNPISATGELLKPFVNTWSNSQVAAVENTVRKAWVTGRTNQQLVQAIRGTKAQNYKDGLVATTTRNAKTVARTAVQHVSQTARATVWESNSDIIEGYEWLSTLDGRTSTKCRSLDGKVFELGKGPVPPVHPNCRSTTVPKFDSSLDFLDKGATRSSVDGPVSASTSYYEWLKTQPAAFQNDAIGVSRATLLRKGGLSAEKFAELNLNKNFEPLTLDEMRVLEPKAFERAGLAE